MVGKENAQRHKLLIIPRFSTWDEMKKAGRWEKWIEATRNEEELKKKVTQVVQDCPYPLTDGDWWVSDYQGFYGHWRCFGECPNLKDIAQAVELMESYGELAARLINHFGGDVDEAQRHLNDKYLGVFDSPADYAEENTKSRISGEIPKEVASYVDYVAMARDWLLSGEIFSIDIVDDTDPDKTQVHIFSNRPTPQ